ADNHSGLLRAVVYQSSRAAVAGGDGGYRHWDDAAGSAYFFAVTHPVVGGSALDTLLKIGYWKSDAGWQIVVSGWQIADSREPTSSIRHLTTGINIQNYCFQKAGVKMSRTVKISSRPTIIRKMSSHLPI